MNYKLHYDLLMQKAQQRINIPSIFEKHHIIPKSMGGTNNKENIVRLTPREHFVAHHLLWKIYNTREMHFAFWCMITRCSRLGTRDYRVNSRTYEILKAQRRILMSGADNPNAKGRSEESRQKSSISLKGKIPWNKGQTGIYSTETLTKMSISAKNKPPDTEATRKKKSDCKIGIKKPYKKRAKRGTSPLKGRKRGKHNDKFIVICPHCNKSGTEWNMKRYHFNNCKNKEN